MPERKCEWCASNIPEEAIVCPNCKKLRKDIHNQRLISYTLSGFSGLVLFLGLIGGWWNSSFGGFQVAKFVTSISGLGVIALFAGSTFYYVQVSRKMGTWWWL